jgi:hypothetical protein
VVDLRHGSIESTNGKVMVCNVHNQVLSHDSKAYKAHITSRTIQNTRWLVDINASESGAGVSKEPWSDDFFWHSRKKMYEITRKRNGERNRSMAELS